MNWKNTWILVGLAVALFAFIFLYERRLNPTGTLEPLSPLFTGFKPSSATSIQLRRGNQFALALERTNGAWRFNKPAYPAAGFAVESFLESLERIVPATYISASELRARKQTSADFGFDTPPVVIALERGNERRELRFGARTPAGDQVYVEMVGQPGYAIISSEILDRLPRTQYDWRNPALFHLGDEPIDRLEITRGGGAGFELRLDATNRLWRLTRPSHRADQIQVRQLLDKIHAARAIEFVSDDPRADVESYGLQAPDFEVTLAGGSVAQKVQFGRSPTNDPSRVYARIVSYTNVLLVPKSVVDLLATPYADLRERQLVAFAPELIDSIEVRGEETNVVRRNGGGGWAIGEMPADASFVTDWLRLLSQLQASEFVKDVVIDFTSYGLAPPQRQYMLRTSITNASGPTNVLVAQLDFGTNSASDRVYARRWDENSVYAIRLLDYTRMPSAAWQLRDHRVWRFTTNQLAKITVRSGTAVREVVRSPGGDWSRGQNWTGEINPFALEEMAFRLGELNAVAWVGRGENARAAFGFGPGTTYFSVELRGEKPQTLSIEFGGLSPLRLPYALTTIDNQPVVFEFPWTLYVDLQRYFNLAQPAGVNRPPAAIKGL